MTSTFPLAILALLAMAHDGAMEREGRSTVKASAISTIDLAQALPGTKGALPVGFMVPLARLFGLSACDYAKAWYVEDRAYAGLNIDNPAISCSVWPTRDRQQIAFAGRIAQGGASLPAVGYVSRTVMSGEAPRGIVLYVIGGPGGDIAPGLNDMLPEELVRRGYAVIKVGYSGTHYGSAYPKPDFDIAAGQVRAYLQTLAKLQPAIPVTMIGESLGAQIAEAALTADVVRYVRSVALVHPLLFSPAAALRNFSDKVGVSDASDSVMTIRSTGGPSAASDASTSANTLRRFAAFYPAEAQDRTLEHYIATNAAAPTMLAYGDADTRIGVGLLPALRARCPHVRVLALPGVNHTIAAPEARAIVDAIDGLHAR